MPKRPRLALMLVAIALSVPPFASARDMDATGSTIECRVIEAHLGAHPAVLAVVFHQAEKTDQPRLASLLLQHSGEEASVRIGTDSHVAGTVFRLKSCFGRGLLLLPADAPPLKDGTTFVLELSGATAAN
jgi:hypothetical protein